MPSTHWNARNSDSRISIRTGACLTHRRRQSHNCSAQTGSPRMDEQRARDDTVAGLFSIIMMLRKDIECIGKTTTDPNTKLLVRHIMNRSLTMPPQENE